MSARASSQPGSANRVQPPVSTQASGLTSTDKLPALIFACLFGAFLGLSLLKFGNPVIMEKYVQAPVGLYEWILGYPWPISVAYWLLGIAAVVGIPLVRWKAGAPWWLPALMMVSRTWQVL